MPRRFSAPRGNGEVLADPGFDEVPALVEANRRLLDRATFRIDGIPLNEIRREVRAEQPPELKNGPLILGGHQPELSHPGVWVKHFAMSGLARKLSGGALNLIVDNDTIKSTSVKLPAFRVEDPRSVTLESVPFDRLDGSVTFEEFEIRDREMFESFPERLRALTEGWPFEPLALKRWPSLSDPTPDSWRFFELRGRLESNWACANIELAVRHMSRTEVFRRFAKHIVEDLPAFHESYNGAIREYRRVNRVRSRTHPAPDLQPF